MALIDRLTAIGDAIRAKTGIEDVIPLVDMPGIIEAIQGGGEDTVKNLAYVIGYPGQSTVSGGLTFTYQEDASILITGALTSSYTYLIPMDKIKPLKPGKTYTLSIESSNVGVDAYLYFDGGSVSHSFGASTIQVISTTKPSVTFSITAGDYKYNHITLMARTTYGTDYSDTVVKIMLEEGEERHPYISPWKSTGSTGGDDEGGSGDAVQIKTQSKTVSPGTDAVEVKPDPGFDALSSVLINAIQTQSLSVSENGEYSPDAGKFFSSVSVDVKGGAALPAGIAAFDAGEITVSTQFTTTRQTFSHNLGVVPDFIFVYAPANVAQTYSMLAAMRGTAVNWRNGYNSFYFYHANSASTVSMTNNSNANYGVGNLTENSFQLSSHSTSYYWRTGKYRYIALKFS